MSPKRLGILAFVLVLAALGVGFTLMRGADPTPSAPDVEPEAVQFVIEQPISPPESETDETVEAPAPAPDNEPRASSFVLSDRSLVAGICTAEDEVTGELGKALATWATAYPIEWKDAFVRTVLHIDATGTLPDCYRTQGEFERLGARTDGLAIGGDPYNNPGDALPRSHNGDYRMADLDYFGERRSRNRLVFVSGRPGESLIWLSLDGLDSFIRLDLDAL